MATGSGTGTPTEGGSTWADLSDVTAYMATRHGNEGLWTALDPTAQQAALTTSHADIKHSDRFDFIDPDTGVEVDVTQDMKDAVCEQILFRLLDPDLDIRNMVQAQNVSEAEEVEEKYNASQPKVPIAPKAIELLVEFQTPDGSGTGSILWVR